MRVKRPRILSVACAHLREAALSDAVVKGKVGTLCALDHDPESLAVVAANYTRVAAVEVVNASVRDLLTGKHAVSEFDLIYSAGLFDYLPTPTARALVGVLCHGLARDGELVIANFQPHPIHVGFMEACMDWPLIWRTVAELLRLGEGAEFKGSAVDVDGCMAYATFVRSA